MNYFSRGFDAAFTAFAFVFPMFAFTVALAYLLAWLLADRAYLDAAGQPATGGWKVHGYWRVAALVAVYSFFGAIQGYLIGSLPDKQSQLIASMLPAAITTAATYIGLVSSQALNDTLRRALAPAIMGFLLCFVLFTRYHTLMTTESGLPDAAQPSEPAAKKESGG